MPKLSIIIPCYNCEVTLRESVDSCYTQEMELHDFEIIMVDDGSKDGTRALMQQLATEHTNITLLFHPENRGGGAARNTGIKQSSGELIYCLDSDNVFAPKSVKSMIEYLSQSGADGVAFYERRFFLGTNLNKFTVKLNPILDRIIRLPDLFNESNTLLDNFFYTRKAYERTSGYPEHHGFDTQCFEMRFLSGGNTVRINPDSIFYHRQAMNEPSYFERVHNSGLFSVNTMVIFEEIFHLFKPEVQNELIDFPIFSQNISHGKNISDFLKLKILDGEEIFISNLEQYLVPESQKSWLESPENEELRPSKYLINCFYCMSIKKYQLAHQFLGTWVEETSNASLYIKFLSLRILYLTAGNDPTKQISSTLLDVSNLSVRPLKRRGGKLWLVLRRSPALQKIVRIFKK